MRPSSPASVPAGGASPRLLELATTVAAGLAGGAMAVVLALDYVHPSSMPDSVATVLWYGVRGAGLSAYLVLWLTTAAGLCVSGRLEARWLPAGAVFFLHQLGDLALSLGVLHALLLLGDRFAGFTPDTLVVPFRASYRPLWSGLGILALYLLAVVQWSVRLRPRLGYRAWRGIHYASFVVFGLALTHGLSAGTDAVSPPLRVMYGLTGTTVVGLTMWRWSASRSRAPRAEGLLLPSRK